MHRGVRGSGPGSSWAGGDVARFALLVLVPLIVVAPANRRMRFATAATGAAVAIVLPMVAWLSSWLCALGPVFIGSGNTPSVGGTVALGAAPSRCPAGGRIPCAADSAGHGSRGRGPCDALARPFSSLYR